MYNQLTHSYGNLCDHKCVHYTPPSVCLQSGICLKYVENLEVLHWISQRLHCVPEGNAFLSIEHQIVEMRRYDLKFKPSESDYLCCNGDFWKPKNSPVFALLFNVSHIEAC